MGIKKVIDAERLDAAMTATADAIREKGGTAEPIPWNELTGFSDAVGAIVAGSPESVSPKDVNFYDYDGTRLYSYTVAEAAALTEMPPLPTQPGLICQGWNWTIEDIKAHNRSVDVGANYITDDGKTRVYISLQEGRTSPMLGIMLDGTATIDWGDGTTPDTLTGTGMTMQWTSNHQYDSAGDYVILITVTGQMGFGGGFFGDMGGSLLRYSLGADARNYTYMNSVRKLEIGENVTKFAAFSFLYFGSLVSISIPNSVTSVEMYAFNYCYPLVCVVLPRGTMSVGANTFSYCYALTIVSIPNSVTTMNSAFFECNSLAHIILPDSAINIDGCFVGCRCIANITVPSGIKSIASQTFKNCSGIRYYDFTKHGVIPELKNVDAFVGIPADCEIRVPAALADEWKVATNWSTYADYIVGV